MGQIGRERVEQELSWAHSQRNLAQAYRTVLRPELRHGGARLEPLAGLRLAETRRSAHAGPIRCKFPGA